jgi:hypothetical protein
MKRRGLLFLTVLTLLCAGLGTTVAGWYSGSPSPRRLESHPHAKAQGPAMTEAAWRYRRCQPVHWRALMLQH